MKNIEVDLTMWVLIVLTIIAVLVITNADKISRLLVGA